MHLIRCPQLVIAMVLLGAAAALPAQVRISEEFSSLEGWQELTFQSIDRLTGYRVVRESGRSLLFIESDDGGSGIVHKTSFDVYQYPRIEWKWRVEDIIAGGDLSTREGDTFAVRIYVNFDYDPNRAPLGQRLRYAAIRALYGEYPPHASLVYIWSNRHWPMQWYRNAHTVRAMMLPVDQGRRKRMQWRLHARSILDDYRVAFGEDPPARASLAVMGDSYGSGQISRAWIDYIHIRSR